MDAPPAGGFVLAIDHDRFFKELITTFFVEFLELFFPKLAASLDRGSIEFLSQEHFTNLFEGDEYHADIVAKARFQGSDAFFLIHVEHQSTAPANFPRRFFRYFSALTEKRGLPVYPIVIYSHDQPTKAQPNSYRLDFPDGEVLRFTYRVVQLNRLSWRRFVNSPNPVASALMAKMKIADRDRPR
ncbi:MAG: Rpn family recombination-promoting nuclease/putative transposase, partial [Candidatus Solibacter usitatus]|nr:Rpn family recombination-promoting nuclease/putative transposase [Candidatus Solibacter usitatus]